jgi:hypothetical protein
MRTTTHRAGRLEAIAGAAALALCAACGPKPDSGAGFCGSTDPKRAAVCEQHLTCPDGPTEVTTAQVHADLLLPTCKDTCHPGLGVLDYSTPQSAQEALVGVSSGYGDGSLRRVDSKTLANSTLWLKVLGGSDFVFEGQRLPLTGPKGEPVGQPMPKGLPRLTEAQLDLVKSWICSGALP